MNPILNVRKKLRYLLKGYEAWQVVAEGFGWKNSFNRRRPLDAQGNPIPWYTYPAVEFLRTLDLQNSRVFEYGCGNSSIFLAQRVKEIYAVENDQDWAAEVKSAGILNLNIITAPKKESYINAPRALGGNFDVIVVDGRYRRECAIVASELVKDDGFIIFDNSDWYPDACKSIRATGRFQIDFSGLGPIAPFPWTTSVFINASISCGRNQSYVLTGASTPVWRDDD